MSVELERIGWENGTLVSKAKVNVDGTIYEVEPAQYSGKSPMSAENLKKMENNAEKAINEATEKNIITAYPNSALTDITEKDQKVILDGYDLTGERFTIENNAIKIGKDISKVLISAQIFYQDGPVGNGYYFPNIKINNHRVARSIHFVSVSGGSSFVVLNINEFIIDVKEGDLITLSTGESSLGFTNLKYRGIQYDEEIKTRHTYITVKAVH